MMVPQLVKSTTSVYTTITTELLPTPAKSHYTFNLRDLSKVFQGMLMAQSGGVKVHIYLRTLNVGNSESPNCPFIQLRDPE